MKRILFRFLLIAIVMVLAPLLTVTFAGSAGMLLCLILFFVLNPIFSVFIGIWSGKNVKKAWYMPLVNAAIFLISAWLLFDMGELAFVWYALFYLVLGYVVMGVTAFVYRASVPDEIKKAKLANSIAFAIVIIIGITLVSCFGIYQYNRNFTQKKWLTNEEERYKIVDNMLTENEIVGISEREIIKLLGEETQNAPISFKNHKGHYADENHLTYFLGVDYMDGEWLVITIEHGIAMGYFIGLT